MLTIEAFRLLASHGFFLLVAHPVIINVATSARKR